MREGVHRYLESSYGERVTDERYYYSRARAKKDWGGTFWDRAQYPSHNLLASDGAMRDHCTLELTDEKASALGRLPTPG